MLHKILNEITFTFGSNVYLRHLDIHDHTIIRNTILELYEKKPSFKKQDLKKDIKTFID